jgi:hypothetical protein
MEILLPLFAEIMTEPRERGNLAWAQHGADEKWFESGF